MNTEKIHRLLLTNRLLLFMFVLAFAAARLYPFDSRLEDPILWACLLIQIGVAFFLLQLNHIFNIIQKRTFLPALFYLLLIGSNPVFYYDLKGSIATLCLVLCYYFLFNSYQKPDSQLNALNISLLLVLGSLLWTPLLFFFPVFWNGFHRFRCLNARVFLANLLGFFVVYLFIFAWSVYQGDIGIFFSFLPHPDTLFVLHLTELTVVEWIISGFLFAVYLAIGIYLFFYNISERVWTISILSYFYFTAFIVFFLLFFQSEYKSSWSLIIYIPIAFLTGYYFSRSSNRVIHYLLLLFILFFIGTDIAQRIGA